MVHGFSGRFFLSAIILSLFISANSLAQTAPSAMRPGASSLACCKTNLVAGDHEHCRRPSIVAIEAKRFERGQFLFASKVSGRHLTHRREFSLPMYPGDHSP